MATKRAQQGGELGANGEFYRGGQFLNTIEENPKREGSRPKGTRKREIAPYVWEVQPTPESRSIYTMIAGIYGRTNRDGQMELDINPVTLAFYHDDEATIRDMATRYNSGQRWV